MSNIEPVRIIGLAPGSYELPHSAQTALHQADIIVGGKRLLAACTNDLLKRETKLLPITGPLKPILKTIQKGALQGLSVVVLADGDPLFFGIGKRLGEELGRENILVEPNISTLQLAAARLKMPWQKMDFISLHGRNQYSRLFASLVNADVIAVLTDTENTPAAIARALLERGADCFSMTVLEDLGTPQEQIRLIPLPDTWGMEFSTLNLVILERQYPPEIPLTLGIPDHFYLHQQNLITKRPVRAAGLAFLNITPESTVWDIGAGSGAVSIEASHLARQGRVFAIERHKTRAAMIRENIRRTGAWLVDTILGAAPECLADLPDPDRIFIGGGLGGSENIDNELLVEACSRLTARGRIVVHTILLDSLHLAKDHFKNLGWHFGVTQLQSATTDPIAGDFRFKAHNPIFILWAEKP